jgi:hypothetical protein
MCDDFYFDKAGEMVRYSKDMLSSPLKVKTTPDLGAYTFGPFANLEESKMFAASIELDEINGPRMVSIEDRKTGEVYTRYLTCKMQPVWNEIEEEEDIDDEEEEFEDPSAEYTYGEEHEDDDDNDEDDEDEEDGDEYVATIPQGEDDEVEDEIEDEYDEEE